MLSILIMLIPLLSWGQSYQPDEEYKSWIDRSVPRFMLYEVGLSSGDTILHTLGRFTRTNPQGIITAEGNEHGGMGTECGCTPRPHGFWIERYADGAMKAQGIYRCNSRVGTWMYYDSRGTIQRVETYGTAWPEMLTDDYNFYKRFPTYKGRKGSYIKYHPNGQLKTNGEYDIVEIKQLLDTIVVDYDPDTYEPTYKIVEGEFWKPRSVPSGKWVHYNIDGTVAHQKQFNIDANPDIRSVRGRFWEFVKEISTKKSLGNYLKRED